MTVVSNAVTTIAPTVVSASAIADTGTSAVYTRGSEFAQALSKVDPAQDALDLLQHAGRLANPDAMASLQTLLQAAAPSPNGPSQPTGSMAQLQQSLQAGGARMRDASRVALDLKF